MTYYLWAAENASMVLVGVYRDKERAEHENNMLKAYRIETELQEIAD